MDFLEGWIISTYFYSEEKKRGELKKSKKMVKEKNNNNKAVQYAIYARCKFLVCHFLIFGTKRRSAFNAKFTFV
jgi:hypothetical protein